MKKIIWLVGMLSIVLLAGCSNNSSNGSKESTTKTTKTESATAYQKLSGSEKTDIKFKIIKGEENSNNAYSLSMKIKNNGTKDVKFDKSKFFLMVDGAKKFSTSLDGNVTLKVGKSITIDDLFKNVSAEKLDGNKVKIAYLNKSNVVASPKLKTSSDESDNATSNTDNAAATSQNATTDQNSDSSAAATPAQPDTSNRVVDSPEQAIGLFIQGNGISGDRSGLAASEISNGYQITDHGTAVGVITFDGQEIDQDGTVKSNSVITNANS
ncbi:hypothetical protein [Companilactobacillus mishanensis]|uniref:DUF4352 domain-containing protein n=1 Tax=Companilactobacillus mishanensis TaxID=2486008 RepID=A0A5P0ZJH7_9LACO|nr:hypothetical protein [Companilactobacillus mishanensis]MQS53239.1 hypothetical protein [Companilactobacillus mishanensis]